MTVLRRAVTIPLTILLMSGVLVVGPALLVITGTIGLLMRSSRPARTVALLMCYAVLELRTLARLASAGHDGDRLMRDFAAGAHAAAQRVLDVEVALDPASVTAAQVPRDEPLIVLSRHCGPGDSVLVAWLLMVEYRLAVRIALKSSLRCEPVLDLAGARGLLCFLRRGEGARQQIHTLAASLAGGQALLLFPEGANFSWSRWREAVQRLHSAGRLSAARTALRQSHTLPARAGGAAAAVAGAPRANVLVLAHNGFCPDGRARLWWQLPVHCTFLARTVLIRAADVPAPDQMGTWLERTWAQVDAWVADNAGR
ncbi:MAG: lysophospholipid acyltransferase family protein [Mycobacterium sp.]